MTPEDRQQLDSHVHAIAQILHRDAQTEGLPMDSLEAIEQTVRAQLQAHVSPGLGNFFIQTTCPAAGERDRRIVSILGEFVALAEPGSNAVGDTSGQAQPRSREMLPADVCQSVLCAC